MIGFRAIPPSERTAFDNVGASSADIHSSRARTSSPKAPNRSTFPSPSFKVQNDRRPIAESSTTQTGIDGEIIPAIGPTAP